MSTIIPHPPLFLMFSELPESNSNGKINKKIDLTSGCRQDYHYL